MEQLGSIFGAKKQTRRRKKSAKKKGPEIIARQGRYLYGTSGSGKTSCLNVFFRSFPDGFPVVRLHWHEFCRDALNYMDQAKKEKGGKTIYALMADDIVGHCRVLLL